MQIITGYTGEQHITSAQDRAGNQGSYGVDSYILNVGNKLAATIVSANEVRVSNGILSHQGCLGCIEYGQYESMEISNGSQGMMRSDLIVCRYERDSQTNVESLSLIVLEGSPSASNPSDPAYNNGRIREGASPADMPLYRVNINGFTITSITQIASSVLTQMQLQSSIGTGSISNVGTNVRAAIGNNVLQTSAQNLSGAINELKANETTIVTDNNSTNGLTIRLYYSKSCPNIMLLKITGTTTNALNISEAYANLWNANTFITNACGNRTAAIIKYILIGGNPSIAIQLHIESGGLIKIGYARNLDDNTAYNIPAGRSIYIEEMLFFK